MTAMIMTNRHGVVLRYNDGSERTFGYSREEVVGKSLAMLLPESKELDAVVGGSDSKIGEILSLLESALENETEVEVRSSQGFITSGARQTG
jgi:PAS domain S-box-containing protein